MKTLSSDDAFFLHFETPDQQQHTVGTMVLDPSTAPGHCDIETLVARLDSCLSAKPEFTQKLVATAFDITAPVLVEDPEYNHAYPVSTGCMIPRDYLSTCFCNSPCRLVIPMPTGFEVI